MWNIADLDDVVSNRTKDRGRECDWHRRYVYLPLHMKCRAPVVEDELSSFQVKERIPRFFCLFAALSSCTNMLHSNEAIGQKMTAPQVGKVAEQIKQWSKPGEAKYLAIK